MAQDKIIELHKEFSKIAIKTIRAWHGMEHVQKEDEEMMWGIYNRNSPEMKRLNAINTELSALQESKEQEVKYPDTEADGYVFCGKCGKMKTI